MIAPFPYPSSQRSRGTDIVPDGTGPLPSSGDSQAKCRGTKRFDVCTQPLPRPLGRDTSRREWERGRADSGRWDAVSYKESMRWFYG